MRQIHDEKGHEIKVCYWDGDARFFGMHKAQFERYLKLLGHFTLAAVKSLDDAEAFSADLLVVSANHVPEDEFSNWLRSIRSRIGQHNLVRIPTLILADVDFATLAELLKEAHEDNWYFDVISPDHLSSVPLRIANLLRIHDHLHELKRYATEVATLQNRVTEIEKQLSAKIKPATEGKRK